VHLRGASAYNVGFAFAFLLEWLSMAWKCRRRSSLSRNAFSARSFCFPLRYRTEKSTRYSAIKFLVTIGKRYQQCRPIYRFEHKQ
jgi:hypothetical protein